MTVKVIVAVEVPVLFKAAVPDEVPVPVHFPVKFWFWL